MSKIKERLTTTKNFDKMMRTELNAVIRRYTAVEKGNGALASLNKSFKRPKEAEHAAFVQAICEALAADLPGAVHGALPMRYLDDENIAAMHAALSTQGGGGGKTSSSAPKASTTKAGASKPGAASAKKKSGSTSSGALTGRIRWPPALRWCAESTDDILRAVKYREKYPGLAAAEMTCAAPGDGNDAPGNFQVKKAAMADDWALEVRAAVPPFPFAAQVVNTKYFVFDFVLCMYFTTQRYIGLPDSRNTHEVVVVIKSRGFIVQRIISSAIIRVSKFSPALA